MAQSLGYALPPHTSVRISEATHATPLNTEHHIDLVVLLEDVAPTLAVGIEVQLSRDPDKPWVVPHYATSLRLRHRCHCVLLIVCPVRSVARWARARIPGGGRGAGFDVLVLGPDDIPRVVDPRVAAEHPQLAVLSGLAHRQHASDLPVLLTALGALAAFDAARTESYTTLILDGLGAAVRKALETTLMLHDDTKIRSPLLKKLFRMSRNEGREEGREEGRVEGRVEGLTHAIVNILEERGIAMSDAERQRFLSATDPTQLSRWLRRSLTAPSADAVLREDDAN